MGDSLEAGLALLDLLPPARGGRRAAHDIVLTYVRDITPDDLLALMTPPVPATASVPALLRLRQSHHMLARLVAQGGKNPEISAMTGYAPATISRLRSDPAFVELVEYYHNIAEQQFLDVHSRLAMLGTTAVEMLQEKLEETPVEQLSIKTLREVGEFALDRSAAPPRRGEGTGGSNGAMPVSLNVTFVSAKDEPAPSVTIEGEFTRGEGNGAT